MAKGTKRKRPRLPPSDKKIALVVLRKQLCEKYGKGRHDFIDYVSPEEFREYVNLFEAVQAEKPERKIQRRILSARPDTSVERVGWTVRGRGARLDGNH